MVTEKQLTKKLLALEHNKLVHKHNLLCDKHAKLEKQYVELLGLMKDLGYAVQLEKDLILALAGA